MQLGFTARQADFLYLVGTQSGVFTTAHYRHYTNNDQRGGPQLRLLARLEKYKFVTRIALTGKDQVIHLSNKVFYRAILTEDSRLRRGMSASLMRQRLQYMDYLVRNPDARYLTTENLKCEYLKGQFDIPEELFPFQIYQGKHAPKGSTIRFFPERYPMYITEESGYPGLGIVYGEDPANRFAAFRRFAVTNQPLFSKIPMLHFVYVSSSPARARLAAGLLTALFDGSHSIQNDDLKRYFKLRQMYEDDAHGTFSDSDYSFWTRHHKQFSAAKYEPLYAEFIGQSSLSAPSFVVRRSIFAFTHFVPNTSLLDGIGASRCGASTVTGNGDGLGKKSGEQY
jgi:hypothetical protein